MEETNIVGLTFKQRIDTANATGWTNQSAPYTDSMARKFLEVNAYPIACVCIVTTMVFGFCFIIIFITPVTE